MSDMESKMQERYDALPYLELEAEIERLTTELAAEKGLHTDRVCTLKKNLDELLARNEALEKVYEAVLARTHMCSGRDCVGLWRELDAASLRRCNDCAEVRKRLDAVQRGEG